ncbi:DUF1990 domain-containing protein [Streptomyces sp. NBC_00047]|uniref:DUF1990 family protein n=1 Tax=Streptomyces sp. NBC_00047 TaxID=2975627 RepID=UPI002258F9E2|nr:DUF1990 domain-containing protein [Streptomyces sp. NBC_00047]MCX5610880.1 DUF1990 domain-containing protein [Streptomyces sp. NBC_00047]
MTRLISTGRDTLSYPDRGATARRPLPAGYHHLHHRTRIGQGRTAFEAAGVAVTTFHAHRTSGMRVRADAGAVRPGSRAVVGIGLGPLRISAPCEVIWTAYEPTRAGFAYGTLTGHPESGEESFVVDMDADGTVWFTVTAFSRPDSWYTRLAGPVIPLLQRSYAIWLGRHVRKLAAAA